MEREVSVGLASPNIPVRKDWNEIFHLTFQPKFPESLAYEIPPNLRLLTALVPKPFVLFHVCMGSDIRATSIPKPLERGWYQGKRRGSKAPPTLIRFQTKTELFCSGYGYCPHYNAENDHRKRSHSKTLSRVERFENDAFWNLVRTEKKMLSEYGEVIKMDTTGRQTTRPWVSKMADRRYHVAFDQFRGPIYWNVHASSSFGHVQRVK